MPRCIEGGGEGLSVACENIRFALRSLATPLMWPYLSSVYRHRCQRTVALQACMQPVRLQRRTSHWVEAASLASRAWRLRAHVCKASPDIRRAMRFTKVALWPVTTTVDDELGAKHDHSTHASTTVLTKEGRGDTGLSSACFQDGGTHASSVRLLFFIGLG